MFSGPNDGALERSVMGEGLGKTQCLDVADQIAWQ